MHRFTQICAYGSVALVLASGGVNASAADADADALSLEAADSAAGPALTRDTKMFVEGAFGSTNQRYGLGSHETRRGSLDFTHTARLGPGLRAVFSDRLDYVHPRDNGADETVNSLREAYLSWQTDGGNNVLEFGRINLRYGPAYGYNPTDFFRDGSLRVITTADPFALRENRLGSVMLRGQRLWSGGSLSVALSPKLANRPSPEGWNPDLGSTNNRNRALVVWGFQYSQRVSGQLLGYKQEGVSPTLGANLTALLSDAVVAHAEFTRGKERDLLTSSLGLPGTEATRNRFSGGLTYTTSSKLSVTAEYQYNGFGADRATWAFIRPMPLAQLQYQGAVLRLQELATRQAYLVYVTQKSLFLKNLDLTAYVRLNAEDHSRLAWLELRHHWVNFDLTLQVQQNIGRPASEFGILPDRRLTQLLGTYYF